MKSFKKVDVSEQQLEDLVRLHAGQIEEGLVYVDHQKQAAGGRLDVLMVDSGKALVVAELKVVQDDGMLMQGVDYYDDVSSHIEAYARLYSKHGVDPTKDVRLLLIAPSFSQTLVTRCKWLDLPISLYTVTCIRIEGETDNIPIFTEHSIPTPRQIVEVTPISDHLAYMTDDAVRAEAKALLDEFTQWKAGHVVLDSIKDGISMKLNNRVFAYFLPRRKFYWISTYDEQDEWKQYPVKDADALKKVKTLMQAAMERRAK